MVDPKILNNMNIEEVRSYILSLPNVAETDPFDENTVVYKVAGKWFAVLSLDNPDNVAVKCDPDRAVTLRDAYPAITPAWHFNKRHWNYLCFPLLPAELVMREIRHSYLTVIRKNVTPKAARLELLADAESCGVKDVEPGE